MSFLPVRAVGAILLCSLLAAGSVHGQAADPPFPPIDPAPTFSSTAYPDCRNDHASARGNGAKANAILRCIRGLDNFHSTVIERFRARMTAYRENLTRTWSRVNGDNRFSYQRKEEFYRQIQREYLKSLPDGEYMDTVTQAAGRYHADRAFLAQEFCRFVTSC